MVKISELNPHKDKRQYLRMFGSNGAGPGQLRDPTGVAVDGDRVCVTEVGNHHVSVFNTEGKFLKSYGCMGEAKAQFIVDVEADTLYC